MTMNETLKTYVSTGIKVAKGIRTGQYIMRISAGFLLLPKKDYHVIPSVHYFKILDVLDDCYEEKLHHINSERWF